MEEIKKRSVSYSQYSMWANCPQQWKLRYVDGFKSDSGIELVFGKAMHETVQHWLTLLYGETPNKAKTFDMDEFLKDKMKEFAKAELIQEGKTLTSKDELVEYYVDGCKILEHVRQYAKDWFPKNYELLGIEIPLDIELEKNIKFTGFIDVVLYHKASKTLYIYDFKTSRWGWSYQKKDPKKTDQLLLYKRFYSEKYGIPEDNIKVEFIILKRKVSENSEYVTKHVVGFEPSNGTVSMKRANERFKTFLEIFDETGQPILDKLVATPSEMSCKYCPFKSDADKCQSSFYLNNSQRKVTKK